MSNLSKRGLDPKSVQSIYLPNFQQLEDEISSKIGDAIIEADTVIHRMKNTIRVAGEKRHHDESLLLSPPAKKMRRSIIADESVMEDESS